MQTKCHFHHLTILLLSKLIISVTSTLSDNEYSQLNRNSKKKKKKKNNAWDIQLLSRERTNPVIRSYDLIPFFFSFCPRLNLCEQLIFHFQRSTKNPFKLIQTVLKDGKYQSHGAYEITKSIYSPWFQPRDHLTLYPMERFSIYHFLLPDMLHKHDLLL